MRLFSLPDGTIDRKDRAQWLTVPFDLAFGSGEPGDQLTIVATDAYSGGAIKSGFYQGGAVAIDAYRSIQKTGTYRGGSQAQMAYRPPVQEQG